MNAETRHKIIRTSFMTLIFVLFALTFWPFFKELLLAALFAFAFHDLSEKFLIGKIKRIYASLLVTLGVFIFIVTPLIFIILKTVTTIKDYSALGLQNTSVYLITVQLLEKINSYVVNLAGNFNIDITKIPNPVNLLSQNVGEIGTLATTVLSKLPQLAMSVFIFFLALFYFLSESEKIKSQFAKFDLLSDIEITKIISILKKSSFRTLALSIFIATLQALIISLSAYFCGFTEFFMIYIVAFTFALIPLVGSVPVSAFLILVLYIQGQNTATIAMLVAALLAGSVDNLLKPIILSSSSKDDLPPILTLITLIGAILIYGAIGILLGPIITQLALNAPGVLKGDEKMGENAGNSDF